MTVGMHIHWSFAVGGDMDLFEHADMVTEALLDQERCTPEVEDSAVSADRGGRVLEIEVSVRAASEYDAIAIGQAAIRSAIHAAGGSTGDWPSHDDVVSLLPTDLRTTPLSTAATSR